MWYSGFVCSFIIFVYLLVFHKSLLITFFSEGIFDDFVNWMISNTNAIRSFFLKAVVHHFGKYKYLLSEFDEKNIDSTVNTKQQ